MPKRYSSRELIELLVEDGWKLARIKGSHHQYSHPAKGGLVTIPHPRKDIPAGTAASVFRQAGLKQRP